MAEFPIPEMLNSTEIIKGFWNSLPSETYSKLPLLIKLSEIILILMIIYFIIAILSKLFHLRDGINIKKIKDEIEEIKQILVLNNAKKNYPQEPKPNKNKKLNRSNT